MAVGAHRFRYVPHLRSKAGEATALRELDAAAKAQIFPIIHLSERPPNTFVNVFAASWNGRAAALDGLFNLAATGGTATFTSMYNDIGNAGVAIIPSVEPSAPSQYIQRVQQVVNRYGPGLVVKSTLAQLPTINQWVAAHGWQPQEVDLVINVGSVSDFDPRHFSGYVEATLNAHLANPNGWRSTTLAGSAAPKDAGALQRGRNEVSRKDWILWSVVHPRMQFDLDYGDYGVSHPDMTEPPGVAMARATVSARYTIDDRWIFLKGVGTSGARGQPMGQQYLQHARTLSNDPHFGAVPNCWGDDRIGQIRTGATKPGSRATWAAISASRHLSFVAHNLP